MSKPTDRTGRDGLLVRRTDAGVDLTICGQGDEVGDIVRTLALTRGGAIKAAWALVRTALRATR